MKAIVFRCCKGKPAFFVQYSVAGFQKNYHVCSDCIKLECFSKYIIEKTPIYAQPKKIFHDEISDETVENEIIDVKSGEIVEQSEDIAEQTEEERLQFSSKKRGAEL